MRVGRCRVCVSCDGVRDDRPGDRPEQGEPDRTSDLLAGIEQTRGYTGVLLAYVRKGDEGQRHELQTKTDCGHKHGTKQRARVVAVFTDPR